MLLLLGRTSLRFLIDDVLTLSCRAGGSSPGWKVVVVAEGCSDGRSRRVPGHRTQAPQQRLARSASNPLMAGDDLEETYLKAEAPETTCVTKGTNSNRRQTMDVYRGGSGWTRA